MSAAFGFGDFKTPRSKDSAFADTILTQWRDRRFESAVGAQDNSLRLAMNAQRELAALAARPVTRVRTAPWLRSRWRTCSSVWKAELHERGTYQRRR
jgi:hypothetical protein